MNRITVKIKLQRTLNKIPERITEHLNDNMLKIHTGKWSTQLMNSKTCQKNLEWASENPTRQWNQQPVDGLIE